MSSNHCATHSYLSLETEDSNDNANHSGDAQCQEHWFGIIATDRRDKNHRHFHTKRFTTWEKSENTIKIWVARKNKNNWTRGRVASYIGIGTQDNRIIYIHHFVVIIISSQVITSVHKLNIRVKLYRLYIV